MSVPLSDATSVAMLESMACGLPVLASDLPANREWLDDNEGLWVPAAGSERTPPPRWPRHCRRCGRTTTRAQRLGERNLELASGTTAGATRRWTRMAALYKRLLVEAARGTRRGAGRGGR